MSEYLPIPDLGDEACRSCPRSLEQRRCCKTEDAAVRMVDAVHELQIVVGGLEGARLLGLPPEAGPLVAAVVYATDPALRREAMEGILEYLALSSQKAVA